MRGFRSLVALCLITAASPGLCAAGSGIEGRVTDPQGKPVAEATVGLSPELGGQAHHTTTDPDGRFRMDAPAGDYRLVVMAPAFASISRTVTLPADQVLTVDLQFARLVSRSDAVTVTASSQTNLTHPDPSERILVREEMLDANPGRPGAPVSIPGLPAETASSGIKAPQYFAPGVAGDHGEPIAQYLQVGGYLIPNNLSANAHGNGYADPSIVVPAAIESIQVDGGAFNVREGNHSVNVATVYGFRERLEPFGTITGDPRDIDLAAGWSPGHPETRAWVAIEASYGNGFLDTLEHRRQYKLNGFRVFDAGSHVLTVLGLGYYGESEIPGLVPIDVHNLHDTIDPRQRDQTHTGEFAANDVWRPAPASELQFSGFFRTYNLALDSNFGDGLIRQSEFRTVAGASTNYVRNFRDSIALMAGVDYLREAPRRLDLDHYDSLDPGSYGSFRKITSNDVTLNFVSPYLALDGHLAPWLHYDLGWRRDQFGLDNTDRLIPGNSFHNWVGVNSPKAMVSLLAPGHLALPSISFSAGQTFFTNDPRIGTGALRGSPASRAHSYQMVVSKTVLATDLRVTAGRVTLEQTLAKIDPDTGLQFNQGPSRNRYITAAARRYFAGGSIQASVSKADARDLSSGSPAPEAPRTIVDVLGTLDRLPWRLHARAEFEEVGRKPLGDGFVSVPVREFRGALARQFHGGKIETGLHFLIASGYTGQTTEVLALAAKIGERITGVYLPSYVAISFRYQFGRR